MMPKQAAEEVAYGAEEVVGGWSGLWLLSARIGRRFCRRVEGWRCAGGEKSAV